MPYAHTHERRFCWGCSSGRTYCPTCQEVSCSRCQAEYEQIMRQVDATRKAKDSDA